MIKVKRQSHPVASVTTNAQNHKRKCTRCRKSGHTDAIFGIQIQNIVKKGGTKKLDAGTSMDTFQ